MISHDDYEIEAWPPRQSGGQHVGIVPTGVKLTHKDTGIIVIVTHERSQHRNRQIALDALAGALTSPHF